VPERVDAGVVAQRRIAERRAPEADVHRIWRRGDRELHLLDRPRQVDMPRFELQGATGQPHREGGIDDRQ